MPRNDLYTRHTIYVVLALEVSSFEPVTGNWLLGVEFEASKDEALTLKVGRAWRGRRCDRSPFVLSICTRSRAWIRHALFVSPNDLEPYCPLLPLFFFLVSLLRIGFSAIVIDREDTRYISFKMIDIQKFPLHCQILGPAISTSNRTNLPSRTWHPLPSPTIIPFPP